MTRQAAREAAIDELFPAPRKYHPAMERSAVAVARKEETMASSKGSAKQQVPEDELSAKELEAEGTAELPDREAMSLIGTDLLPPICPAPVPDVLIDVLPEKGLPTQPIEEPLPTLPVLPIDEPVVSVEIGVPPAVESPTAENG